MNNDTWLPELGEECEITNTPYTEGVTVVKVLAFLGGYLWLSEADKTYNAPFTAKLSDVRPIESNEDKYRENQIGLISSYISGVDTASPWTEAMRLFSIGCRIISSREYVVSPLTEDQMHHIWKSHNTPYDTVEYIQELQRASTYE